MALSSMIRRSSSSVLPLAIRAVGSPRSFHGAIAMSVNVHERTTPSLKNSFQSHCYSSATGHSGAKKLVDESLIRIINSEIKSVNSVKETLKGFPFTIEINCAEGTVILTREDGDEHIKVVVKMTALVNSVCGLDNDSSDSDNNDTTDDSEDDSCEETNTDKNKDIEIDSKNKSNDSDDDSSDVSDDTGDDSKKAILMTASVSKGNIELLHLEFDVVAFADNIDIQSLTIKDSTDDCDNSEAISVWDVNPELKHALHNYLGIRGINLSMVERLKMYMISKKSKDSQWLKKLRRFIKK